MVDKSKKAEMKTAYGKPLETPISYEWTWKEYADEADFTANGTPLTVKEQMEYRNSQAEGKARSAADTAAKDAAGLVKPTAANDVQVAMKAMLKPMLVSLLPNGQRKFTDEQARTIVETTYGEKLED